MRRREQWDLAIAEVKQELGSGIEEGDEISQEVADFHREGMPAPEMTGDDLEVLNSAEDDANVDDFVFSPLGGTEDRVEDTRQVLDSTVRRSRRPRWPFNTGPDRSDVTKVEAWLKHLRI